MLDANWLTNKSLGSFFIFDKGQIKKPKKARAIRVHLGGSIDSSLGCGLRDVPGQLHQNFRPLKIK